MRSTIAALTILDDVGVVLRRMVSVGDEPYTQRTLPGQLLRLNDLDCAEV